MGILYYIFFLALGAIIGSFLNVVIFRYGTGRSVGGRSSCMACGKELAWYDLVPIFSYFMLRGKCRRCKSNISLQYAGVEVLTALLFLWIGLHARFPLHAIFLMIVFSLLIVILVYDMRHKIIPDALVYTFIILSFVSLFLFDQGTPGFYLPYFADLIAGPLLFTFFFLFWFLSRGQWMGVGDAKLVLGIGWFLGMAGGITAVIFSFWIGAAVGIFIIVGSRLWYGQRGSLSRKVKPLTMKSEIPFAPFLIVGFWIVLMTGIHLIPFMTALLGA